MRPEVRQAVEVLRKGSPDALERALRLLQGTILSFSMRVCGHREDAEDTMQETLLQAISRLSTFDNPKALAVWLYKVAKTRCLMSRRRSKFAPKKELSIEALMPDRRQLEQLASASSGPEETTLRRESAEKLQKMMLQLPPAYRLVLVLHDVEELSTREVAQVTDLREGTVRVRLHRARVFVRNKLANSSGLGTPSRKPTHPRPRHCRRLFAELSEYLDKKLDVAECDKIERHMRNCRPCQAFLTSLEQTVEQLRRRNPSRLGSRTAAATRAAILARYRRARASLQAK